MKVTPDMILYLAVGVLVGFVIYRNVKGIKDKEPNYSAKPSF